MGVISRGSLLTLRSTAADIATITTTKYDDNCWHGTLEAREEFEQFRPLFAAQLAAMAAEDWHEAGRVYHEIRAALSLRRPDGSIVPEFLLHIDGSAASFRWSDEPFSE